MQIKIKYFSNDIDKIEKIPMGDWIDLRAAETVALALNERAMIPLGVGMILPDGYEAIVAPRSSLQKKGIIMGNSIGVIDNSYSGDDDQWHFPAICVTEPKNGWDGCINGVPVSIIEKNERICQFRIQKIQPTVEFVEVEHLNSESRGGIGSTGKDDFTKKPVEYHTFKDGSRMSVDDLKKAILNNSNKFPGQEMDLNKLFDIIMTGWVNPDSMYSIDSFVADAMKHIV